MRYERNQTYLVINLDNHLSKDTAETIKDQIKSSTVGTDYHVLVTNLSFSGYIISSDNIHNPAWIDITEDDQ